ncbi:MAG TPA: histidine phosphatase family protein [Bryobacteraceae bacterium]|nr:histidine phosphatase family protein [Bryobacteraceae bacterium]
MSTLTVVRHAQARPFQQDSDRLSELGEAQARALAEYWSRNGVEFDEVWCGSLARHCRTAALAIEKAATISPDWNEYDSEGILRGYPPPSSFPDNRAFQKTFETAMEKWMEGLANGAEPFAAFRERVLRGLRRIQEGPSNRRVVLFTSGGPIGILVQTALGAPERSFLDVNWRVRNCSITEFVFSRDRLSLDCFNAIPHLCEALRSFR